MFFEDSKRREEKQRRKKVDNNDSLESVHTNGGGWWTMKRESLSLRQGTKEKTNNISVLGMERLYRKTNQIYR